MQISLLSQERVNSLLESFFGELHPHDFKTATSGKAICDMPPPPFVVIPMAQHIGQPCSPLVAVGDYVKMGQKIGDSTAPISAPVHASVSGKVIAVEPKLHPNGSKVMSVVIENDGLDTMSEEIFPHKSEDLTNPEVLCRIVNDAGIVGMGGATFPAAAKIKSSLGKIDTLIINGAECEPFITSDHRVMLEHPDELLEGIRILKRVFGITTAYIGIEKNKPDAIKLLSSKSGDIKVFPLKSVYPQGAEKQLVRSVTNREVPPGGLPAAVGCVVFNVFTAYSVYRAIYKGLPAISRVVTVSGEAVKNPGNFNCRVGTPIEYLIEAAGGFSEPPFKLLMGGPMMGASQYDLSVPVIKGTNAVLALSSARDRNVKNPTCIRCGRCIEACPMRLMPMLIHMYEAKNDLESLEKYHVNDCMECGLCTFVCPGRLYITQSCRLGKAKLRAAKEASAKKAEGALKNG